MDAVQDLRREYPNILIEGMMFHWPVCLECRTVYGRVNQHHIHQGRFKAQFIPTLRCFGCSDDKLYCVSPSLREMQAFKTHLNDAEHQRAGLDRTHNAWTNVLV